jgi:hypothetical protein
MLALDHAPNLSSARIERPRLLRRKHSPFWQEAFITEFSRYFVMNAHRPCTIGMGRALAYPAFEAYLGRLMET